MCELYFEIESVNEEGVYSHTRPMSERILAKIKPQRV